MDRVKDQDIFPCVIVPTRYSGVYEGGRWVAFPADIKDIVGGDWQAGDPWAAPWWHKHRASVGVGDTPEEAYDALKAIPPERRWSPKNSGFTRGL
jgi:hypothetical protein